MTAYAVASRLALALALLGASPSPAAADEGPAPILAAAPASAQEPDAIAIARARGAYDDASRAFYAGRLDEALSLALVAWEAVPNASSALIVATILAEQGRACDVLPYLLAGIEREPLDAEAAQIEALWTEQGARCDPGYGWLALSAGAPGAWVEVGGARHALPRALALTAGDWALRAGADGHEPSERVVTVAASRGRGVDLALAAQVATPAPTPDPEPRAPTATPPAPHGPHGGDVSAIRATDDTLGWSLVIGGAAATIASGVLVGLAVADVDAGQRVVARAGAAPTDADRAALDAANTRARRLETGAWVAGGVGLAALIAGAVLLAAGDDPVAADPDAAALRVELRRGGGAVTFGGRF